MQAEKTNSGGAGFCHRWNIGAILEDGVVTIPNVDGFEPAAQLKMDATPAALAGRKSAALRQRNLVHQAMGVMNSLVDPVFRNDLSGMVFLGHSNVRRIAPGERLW